MRGEQRVAWLSEISKKDVKLAGGKGANLGEMYNSGFPVPPAFVVTTTAFNYFVDKSGIKPRILEILKKIDIDNTSQIREKTIEIREIVTNAKMPEDLENEIIEAYDNFNTSLDGMNESPGALAILKSAREPVFVSVRSSATAEDLSDASFAGQQDSFINVKGNREVIENVKKVFASIFTARSLFYRMKKGFEGFVPIAAVVQKMINSDKSGVIFSVNPVTQKNILIEAVFGQGEGIVSGRIKPDEYSVSEDFEILDIKVSNKKIAIVRDAGGITKTVQLKPEVSNLQVLKKHEISSLAEFSKKLEKHYNQPQDIEFALEDGKIYILQTRAITTLKERGEQQELTGQLLTSGLGASPGVASGIVKIVKTMDDLSKIKTGDVLVTKMTNPDMVVTMQKASAIVTSEGGVTAHAAIVSREMGIPAVVGTDNALEVLEDGMEITVDGFHGKVYAGRTENKKVEIKPIVKTRTKIKVLVDIPDFAERAAKTNAYGIGLIRLEGIIASSGKHPLYFKETNNLHEYTKVLENGLRTIAEKFIGKEMWIRTSDIRSDEYSTLQGAPKEIERNPMLGNHGIRFSLKHQDIFRAELQAVKNLVDKGHKFGLMFPQIISPEEVKQAKEIIQKMGMLGNPNLKIGVMIETPAASLMIKDICEEGIDFASFGTNDLTQYTLAIDRGNDDVQYIYNEMNWAVLKQISRVIRECKNYKVETSICGQAGSNPEMVKYLIKQGIDSISVNADAAYDISVLVKQLEEEKESPKIESSKSTIEPINNIDDIKKEIDEREKERMRESKKENEEVEKEISINGQGVIENPQTIEAPEIKEKGTEFYSEPEELRSLPSVAEAEKLEKKSHQNQKTIR